MTVQDQGEAGFVILDRNGNFYARTYSSVDARLIAAAPMLLTVAEGALGYLEALPENARPDETWMAPLRAAILQATAGSVRAAKGETNA